jgi:hypothetical protein
LRREMCAHPSGARSHLTGADRVIAFRVGNGSPFKLFYTRAGASSFASGINPAGSILRFGVRGSARALESYTTGTLDVWTVPSEDQPLVFAPRRTPAA